MRNKGKGTCCQGQNIYKHGSYTRKSDGMKINRYRCNVCKCTHSDATDDPEFGQNKRHLNPIIHILLACGLSMNRLALILGITYTTVSRKLHFLGEQSAQRLHHHDLSEVDEVQFDELFTIEHTNLKPVVITMIVQKGSRKILRFKVGTSPANGKLAEISTKKYGKRKNEREEKLEELFSDLSKELPKNILIESDKCPMYKKIVNCMFPMADYKQYKCQKSTVAGQGELKTKRYEPIFSINHSFAMLRANINRLFRRTWCTTKRISALISHLYVYADFHNRILTPNSI